MSEVQSIPLLSSRAGRVSRLAYYSGKSPHRRIGPWVAGTLRWRRDSCHVERFADMLGVLLCRRPVRSETVDDRDGNLVCWWRMGAGSSEKACRPAHTDARSRDLCREACLRLKAGISSPVRRALLLHICIAIHHGTCAYPESRGIGFEENAVHRGGPGNRKISSGSCWVGLALARRGVRCRVFLHNLFQSVFPAEESVNGRHVGRCVHGARLQSPNSQDLRPQGPRAPHLHISSPLLSDVEAGVAGARARWNARPKWPLGPTATPSARRWACPTGPPDVPSASASFFRWRSAIGSRGQRWRTPTKTCTPSRAAVISLLSDAENPAVPLYNAKHCAGLPQPVERDPEKEFYQGGKPSVPVPLLRQDRHPGAVSADGREIGPRTCLGRGSAGRHQIVGGIMSNITNKKDIETNQEILRRSEDTVEHQKQRMVSFAKELGESHASTGRGLSLCDFLSAEECNRLKGTAVEDSDKDLHAIAGRHTEKSGVRPLGCREPRSLPTRSPRACRSRPVFAGSPRREPRLLPTRGEAAHRTPPACTGRARKKTGALSDIRLAHCQPASSGEVSGAVRKMDSPLPRWKQCRWPSNRGRNDERRHE